MTEGRLAALAPRARASDAPFALGAAPRSWGDLLADAAALAEALAGPAQPERMVACGDRYFAAVALLAVWQAGGVAALPPNGRKETIDRLCAERGIPLVLHDGGGEGGLDIRGLLGAARGTPTSPAFAPEQVLVSVYTSGSTGTHLRCPKTAGQLLGEAALLARLFEIGPGARLLATVPAHHLYGLLFGVLVPFMGGGAFVRTTPLHAETIAAEARSQGASLLCSVPAHLRGVARLPPGALPALTRIFSSGAPLDRATAAEVVGLTGTAVTEVLGSSETGGIAWRSSPPGAGWQPFPGIEVRPDADGRMLVRSPFVAPGEGEPAAATRAPAGWTRSADRIAVRSDGGFDLVGRADGVIKIGGSRIAVAETERLLREIPGVLDAAVVSIDVPGPRRHELWAAVAAPGLTVPALRAALLRRLEPVAVPRRFRLVGALPREDSGKLVRERLLALFAAAEQPERRTIPVSVPADWKFFEGHFEGFPILPGVVQLNEIVLGQVRACWSELRHLRRITGLKFRSPIAPGDNLALRLDRAGAGQVSFELRRGSDLVSCGTLEFDRSDPDRSPRA